MGLWKPAVEQILEEAGTQNQETERKHLRGKNQLRSKGALCAAQQENQKKDSLFKPGARERVTENRDKVPMGPSRGYVVQKEGSRK